MITTMINTEKGDRIIAKAGTYHKSVSHCQYYPNNLTEKVERDKNQLVEELLNGFIFEIPKGDNHNEKKKSAQKVRKKWKATIRKQTHLINAMKDVDVTDSKKFFEQKTINETDVIRYQIVQKFNQKQDKRKHCQNQYLTNDKLLQTKYCFIDFFMKDLNGSQVQKSSPYKEKDKGFNNNRTMSQSYFLKQNNITTIQLRKIQKGINQYEQKKRKQVTNANMDSGTVFLYEQFLNSQDINQGNRLPKRQMVCKTQKSVQRAPDKQIYFVERATENQREGFLVYDASKNKELNQPFNVKDRNNDYSKKSLQKLTLQVQFDKYQQIFQKTTDQTRLAGFKKKMQMTMTDTQVLCPISVKRTRCERQQEIESLLSKQTNLRYQRPNVQKKSNRQLEHGYKQLHKRYLKTQNKGQKIISTEKQNENVDGQTEQLEFKRLSEKDQNNRHKRKIHLNEQGDIQVKNQQQGDTNNSNKINGSKLYELLREKVNKEKKKQKGRDSTTKEVDNTRHIVAQSIKTVRINLQKITEKQRIWDEQNNTDSDSQKSVKSARQLQQQQKRQEIENYIGQNELNAVKPKQMVIKQFLLQQQNQIKYEDLEEFEVSMSAISIDKICDHFIQSHKEQISIKCNSIDCPTEEKVCIDSSQQRGYQDLKQREKSKISKNVRVIEVELSESSEDNINIDGIRDYQSSQEEEQEKKSQYKAVISQQKLDSVLEQSVDIEETQRGERLQEVRQPKNNLQQRESKKEEHVQNKKQNILRRQTRQNIQKVMLTQMKIEVDRLRNKINLECFNKDIEDRKNQNESKSCNRFTGCKSLTDDVEKQRNSSVLNEFDLLYAQVDQTRHFDKIKIVENNQRV